MRFLALPAVLLLLAPPAPAADVTAVKDAEAVTFRDENGHVIARYQYAGRVNTGAKDGQKDLAKPFFYPLNAPGQVPVTRGWPVALDAKGDSTKDHVHQKSVWFCHGDVIPEGLELKVKSVDKRVHGVDFWAESPGHGRIVCTEVGEPKQLTKGHVVVPTRNEWRAADGTKILDESRTIHLVALPAGYLIGLEIDLHASACPITFGDTKEGSMGVRVNDVIRLASKDGGVITSSDGETIKAPARDNLSVWGKPADWHDYSGVIDGKPAGIAVFDHPANPVRSSWHTRAYGLMAANPFGRDRSFPSQKGNTDLVKLAKGEHLKLRYGVYAHAGDASAGKVGEAFRTFTEMK